MPEHRIHLEDTPPPCCSACYQPQPEKRHVDFSASTDGPVTNVIPDGSLGVVGHVVDEIIVCEVCIETAARLLGLEDVTKLRAELDAANERNDALHDQLTEQRQAVTDTLDGLRRQVTGETPAAGPRGNLLLPQSQPAQRQRRSGGKRAKA